MDQPARTSALLLACFLALPAGAQVYRCGGSNAYTDKPCEGAKNVDVRANIMDAGPRMALQPIQPAAAVVMPAAPAVPKPGSGPSSIWERKASDDAAHIGRTTGTR
jgi:hypothetical protein